LLTRGEARRIAVKRIATIVLPLTRLHFVECAGRLADLGRRDSAHDSVLSGGHCDRSTHAGGAVKVGCLLYPRKLPRLSPTGVSAFKQTSRRLLDHLVGGHIVLFDYLIGAR
jgi:hypothetical protein